MSIRSKKWLKNIVRWGIAVFGIWYVISNMSWYDRVLISGPGGWPIALRLAEKTDENAPSFKIVRDGSIETIRRAAIQAKWDLSDVEETEIRIEPSGAVPAGWCCR